MRCRESPLNIVNRALIWAVLLAVLCVEHNCFKCAENFNMIILQFVLIIRVEIFV